MLKEFFKSGCKDIEKNPDTKFSKAKKRPARLFQFLSTTLTCHPFLSIFNHLTIQN
jgi:hypothetical protein